MTTTAGPAVEPAAILVVDDVEASRYLIASRLRRGGYRVTEAATGAEALSLALGGSVDLMVLDVNLPDMSGLEVCARIKTDPRTAAMPVIHLSATAIEPEDEVNGLNGGADAYLVEPVNPRVLVATVEAALRYYRARTLAERLAARLDELTRITYQLNSATSFHGLLAAAARGAATMFGGTATVLTSVPPDTVTAVTAAPGADPVVHTEPAGTAIMRGGLPEVVTVDRLDWHPGAPATVFVTRPVQSRQPVCVAVDAAKVASDEDRHLLLQLGQATALACEGMRARSEEHTLALTLQRSLLPREVPDVAGLDLAVRYVPAAHNIEVGGDFYEVAELDDRVLVAVGDVVGHSIEAATAMGEIRHALRAYALEGHDAVAILDRLDALVRRFQPEWFTTMCLMLVDPVTGTAEVANAGHLPPLIADGSGTSRYLPVSGPLLGAGWPRPAATRVELPPGTLVLLVTDGLVERRRTTVDDGLAALRDHVTHDVDLQALCDSLLDRFGHDAEDDIALVAFRTELPRQAGRPSSG
ncbi:SpoIIE family protein phosphatase [Actinophytocola sp.]|uniref:SpoIIE family protein phosphatase n=1 Tax=Actinophytocola sp. TaxID=1872138 RepID=UPI003899F5CC